MEISVKRGDRNAKKQVRWYHLFLVFTIPVGLVLTLIAGLLMLIVDFIYMDTHHIDFKVTPNKWWQDIIDEAKAKSEK